MLFDICLLIRDKNFSLGREILYVIAFSSKRAKFNLQYKPSGIILSKVCLYLCIFCLALDPEVTRDAHDKIIIIDIFTGIGEKIV